jgi:ABC-type transport system involved in cytochrome c biogenesis permease subunit
LLAAERRSKEAGTLDQLENLRTIAEVATAFAGFTGVVIILGHRSSGSWSASEHSTIRILLEASIGTVFFALLPAISRGSGG